MRICAGCGDPLDTSDELTPDKKRHKDCVCKCHELGCRRLCFEDDCKMIHISEAPCKGQCGCAFCLMAYQDFHE